MDMVKVRQIGERNQTDESLRVLLDALRMRREQRFVTQSHAPSASFFAPSPAQQCLEGIHVDAKITDSNPQVERRVKTGDEGSGMIGTSGGPL